MISSVIPSLSLAMPGTGDRGLFILNQAIDFLGEVLGVVSDWLLQIFAIERECSFIRL